jgi:hypothetical protein
MNYGFKGLLLTIWQRLVLSYKSTAIGLAIGAATIVSQTMIESPNAYVKWAGSLLSIYFLSLKDKNKFTAPVAPTLLLALVLSSLTFATPARADGPLTLRLSPDLSLRLNVAVPALGYSLTKHKLLGQVTFGVNYVLDYKEKIAVGFGGGFAQTNDTPGGIATVMVAGPVLNATTEGGLGLRPALLYEYRWLGAEHENIVAGTLALQF